MKYNFLMIVPAVLLLAGCATTKGPGDVGQLQIKVSQLERTIEDRNQEITDLKDQVTDLNSRFDSVESAGTQEVNFARETKSSSNSVSALDVSEIIKVSASAKDVQKALKNAGYYDGNIDGKIGAMSQKAIAAFQKDHGLESDGVVGQRTWSELKKNLQ